MPGSLKVWNIGPVKIYPHLSWNKCLSPETLREKANEVKSKLNDLDVEVLKQSSYTAETNGPWNVTISVKSMDVDSGKTFKFI